MGCASSKHHSDRCRHCHSPCLPPSRKRSFSVSKKTKRSFSLNVHGRRPRKKDGYHMVALTSSTLGSLKLDPPSDQNLREKSCVGHDRCDAIEDRDDWKKNDDIMIIDKNDFVNGVMEAKAWSKMIEQKIPRKMKPPPKTPIRTPPGEPETINVKELMEGLEDSSSPRYGSEHRSFSFHVQSGSISHLETPRQTAEKEENELEVDSPTRGCVDGSVKENENVANGKELTASDFNPEIISAFRKALEELPPSNPFYLKPLDDDQHVVVKNEVVEEENMKMNGITSIEVTEEKKINGDVVEEKKVNVVVASGGYAHINSFVEKMSNEGKLDSPSRAQNGYNTHTLVWSPSKKARDEKVCPLEEGHLETGHLKNPKERVILYFTSLRGVRKTYEDCCYVRLILKGLGVRVDERDVSMHAGFKEELKDRLGLSSGCGLPKVFWGEKFIGGVEEIRRMHEDGQLEKALAGYERWEDDSGNLNGVCNACGDIRFVPCETCSGSCKVYYEDEDEEEDEDEDRPEDECGFKRCPDCNENGLIRCPLCCD